MLRDTNLYLFDTGYINNQTTTNLDDSITITGTVQVHREKMAERFFLIISDDSELIEILSNPERYENAVSRCLSQWGIIVHVRGSMVA